MRDLGDLIDAALAVGSSGDADAAEEIALGGGGAEDLAGLLSDRAPLGLLSEAASARRNAISGRITSFSPKVFIDLTRLCRDRCSYCTFVRTPRSARIQIRAASGDLLPVEEAAYLSHDRVLEIARAGKKAGCLEALFTLGDRPEDRYEVARSFLRERGLDSTAEYVIECARLVLDETGLLPHVNPGVMTDDELAGYRKVSVSAGLMLESTSRRLFEVEGECHFGSPDKDPDLRLSSIESAGRFRVPFTTGLLIGIGESREDRVATIAAIAASAIRHGHVQEVIVQNFRAKATIPMREHPEPGADEVLRVIALARLLLPSRVAVQAPPNLMPGEVSRLLEAGLSDWGGISPVTPDHVNPEAPWPEVSALESECEACGFELRPRLAIHPGFVREGGWLDAGMVDHVEVVSDADGWARGAPVVAGARDGGQGD